MFSYEELSTLGLVGRFARGRFTRGGPNALSLAAYADRGPDDQRQETHPLAAADGDRPGLDHR